MEEKMEQSKMGTAPVNKLMLGMGIPIILSMMLQAFYNIVDSAFVSNMAEYGEEALNALTLAFPVQLLIVAVGVGTGVGTNALASKALGQKDFEKANRVAGNACFVTLLIYIFWILFGIFGVEWYIGTQTANEVIYEMAVSYLRICCVVSFGMVYFSVFEKLLQSTGRSLYSTIAQVLGAATNIVLDPILIYGLGFFPQMGVRGAAVATVIGQIVSFVSAFLFHLRFDKEFQTRLSYFKPVPKIIGEIYAIGLPAIIAQALMSIMTYGLNRILVIVGENMVTAYGLYYKIQQFILFAAFGLRDTITPVVSFSHGMRNRERIQEGMKYGIIYTLVIMIAGTVILELLAVPLCGVFGISGETQALCVAAMRIISVSFVFAGSSIAFQGIFQAIDGGVQSLIISVCRQLIFVLPVAWLFVRMIAAGNMAASAVWWTFPIAEVITTVIGIFLLRGSYKKKVAVL
ncbi:MAG: MATE family efflux transporter [Lachnospiraceae bacterium]|nr:MATE family efflux transporter [Lachnospiraceae bacterium]